MVRAAAHLCRIKRGIMWAGDRGPITHHHPDTSRTSLRSGKYNNPASGLTTPSQGQRRGSRFTTSPNLGDIHYLIPPETGVFRFVTPRRFCWWLGVRRHRIGDNVLKFKGRSPPPKTYSLSVLLITSWATGRLISKLIPPCRF